MPHPCPRRGQCSIPKLEGTLSYTSVAAGREGGGGVWGVLAACGANPVALNLKPHIYFRDPKPHSRREGQLGRWPGAGRLIGL